MTSSNERFEVMRDATGSIPISATDIAQYQRSERCARALRIRMFAQTAGEQTLHARFRRLGISIEQPSPFPLAAGRAYEAHINSALSSCHTTIAASDDTPIDGSHVRRVLLALAPGESQLVLQPSLQTAIEPWLLTGRPDVMLLRRTDDGALVMHIADIKSARAATYDHHMQVGIYERICRSLYADIADLTIVTAVLYQPPLIPARDQHEQRQYDTDAARAAAWFGIPSAWCSIPANPDQLRSDIARIIAQLPHADAYAAWHTPFAELPYALGTACRSCPFMQYCLLRADEQADIALIPGLDREQRSAFRQHGIQTVPHLANLASVSPERALVPSPAITASLIADQTIGPALEDWIARAQRQRSSGMAASAFLPTATVATLPRITAQTNPHVCILTIEPHIDGGTGLLWGLAVRIQPHRAGVAQQAMTHIDVLPAAPTLADEGALIVRLCTALAHAHGSEHPPIHSIVAHPEHWPSLCSAINRHLGLHDAVRIWADILMQPRTAQVPMCTVVMHEVGSHNAFTQPVSNLILAARQYSFDWVASDNFPTRFYAGLFDTYSPRNSTLPTIQIRARYHDTIPSEYTAAAWGMLPPARDTADPYSSFRGCTISLLQRFVAHRLAAIVHLATKACRWSNPAIVPAPPSTSGAAPTFLNAISDSLVLERAAVQSEWYRTHTPHPAARVRSGTTIIATYRDALQPPAMAERITAYREAAGSQSPNLTSCTFTLAIASDGALPPLALQRALSGIMAVGAEVIVAPLPPSPAAPQHPHTLARTGMRARVTAVDVVSDRSGTITFQPIYSQRRVPFSERGDTFLPLDGESYTIDANPDNQPGIYTDLAVQRLAEDPHANTLAQLLTLPAPARATTLSTGMDAYVSASASNAIVHFGADARTYVADHAQTPLLLVQGPPGTGKTFTTAHAILARISAACACNQPLRITVTAQTHAAVDALIGALSDVIGTLRVADHPARAAVAQLRLIRYRGNAHTPALAQVIGMHDKAQTLRAIAQSPWCIVAATPTPLSTLLAPHQPWCDLLFLDESSQLALPLALAAATVVQPLGSIVVIGDPRQMPAIVSHDWDAEPHRQFKRFPVFQSLYDYIEANPPAGQPVPIVRLSESRRVPSSVAAFLQSVIYHRDGITYHSSVREQIPLLRTFDPLLQAVLDPAAALVLITHDEDRSHTRNPFEVALIVHILSQLIPAGYDGHTGYGVVVPHRMQRAAISDALRPYVPAPPVSLLPTSTALPGIDTVERFQGSQRHIMLVSATESHPATLARNETFLYDMRRLNVALSRAQRKVIVLASQTVFAHSPQSAVIQQQPPMWQAFARWCDTPVYDGVFAGIGVHVTIHRASS